MKFEFETTNEVIAFAELIKGNIQFSDLPKQSDGDTITVTHQQLASILAHSLGDKKIQAIKLYRLFTETMLKEAKEAIECAEPFNYETYKKL